MKKIWDQILRYFYLKKREPNAPKSIEVKLMHAMNRIAILTFLICIAIMLVRVFKHFFK